MWETINGPSTSHSPQPQEPNSDSNLFEQVETFEGEEEEDNVLDEVEHYQSDEGK